LLLGFVVRCVMDLYSWCGWGTAHHSKRWASSRRLGVAVFCYWQKSDLGGRWFDKDMQWFLHWYEITGVRQIVDGYLTERTKQS